MKKRHVKIMPSQTQSVGITRGKTKSFRVYAILTILAIILMFTFLQMNLSKDPVMPIETHGLVKEEANDRDVQHPYTPTGTEVKKENPTEAERVNEQQEEMETKTEHQEEMEKEPTEMETDAKLPAKPLIFSKSYSELESIPEFMTYNSTPVPGASLEDEELPKLSTVQPNPLTGLTFTHVYSPFVGQNIAEGTVVASSINAAVEYAHKHGISVEVVAVVLDKDLGHEDLVLADNAKVVTVSNVFQDVYPNATKGNVPFIGDILSASRSVAGGSYTILTNPDIVLDKTFYTEMVKLLERRPADWQSVTINRRTIPVESIYKMDYDNKAQDNKKAKRIPDEFYKKLGEENIEDILEKINSIDGEEHPGHDCFAFPTEWIPRLSQAMEGFVVGSPVWGCWFRFLVCERKGGIEAGVNVSDFKESLSRSHLSPCTYTKYKITRHLGNDKGWKKNVVPWVWNTMWLYIDVTRGFSGTDAYASEAISSCKSKNPCSVVSMRRMSASNEYKSFAPIHNRSCELYKKVKLKKR